jgi:Domain of unknown function (DUF4149)
MRYRFGLMLAALWWGSLTALGFIIVPILFTHMPTPAEAGQLAAKLFTAQTWLSIACSMFLLLIFNQKEVVAHDLRAQAAIKFIVTGLLLATLVEFGLSPRIISARADGGNLKFLHALGSAMYFAQWVCAGFALWRLSRAK